VGGVQARAWVPCPLHARELLTVAKPRCHAWGENCLGFGLNEKLDVWVWFPLGVGEGEWLAWCHGDRPPGPGAGREKSGGSRTRSGRRSGEAERAEA
jgi:hypothetical protein